MTDPLPPELKELVAAERAAPAPDAAARAAARARLAAAVGHAPPGAAGALGAGKLLAILAVVVGAGTFAVLHGRGESHARPAAVAVASKTPTIAPAAPPRTAESIAAPGATEQLAASPTAPESPHVEERSAAKNTTNAKKASSLGALRVVGGQSLRSPTTSTRSTASTPSTPDSAHVDPMPSPAPAQSADTTTQAELIRQAWSALAVGEPDRALSIVRDDARLHKGGALDEERDAVRIVALARLGRLDEARVAATQFDHDYPSSLHHDLVQRALAGGPDHDR